MSVNTLVSGTARRTTKKASDVAPITKYRKPTIPTEELMKREIVWAVPAADRKKAPEDRANRIPEID